MVVGDHVLPAWEGLFSNHGVRNWVLQQNRKPPHTAARPALKKYIDCGFSCVDVKNDWLGNTLELNPIEYVWCIVLDNVQKRGCSTILELWGTVDGGLQQRGRRVVKHIF